MRQRAYVVEDYEREQEPEHGTDDTGELCHVASLRPLEGVFNRMSETLFRPRRRRPSRALASAGSVCASSGMTWQEWVQLVGAVVSALAAVGAIVFAGLTVRQTRELRREDRLARLGELVGDYAQPLLRAMQGGPQRATEVPIARARLEASLAAAGEPLPACHALLEVDKPGTSIEEVIDATKTAADELARLVRGGKS